MGWWKLLGYLSAGYILVAFGFIVWVVVAGPEPLPSGCG
jgi:nitrate reductase NapE component